MIIRQEIDFLSPIFYESEKFIMLAFFHVEEKFTKFLQTFDKRVPMINYRTHDKFLCGTVLEIGNHQYYVPVSSNVKRMQTSLLIEDAKGVPFASLRFCFMFPATATVLTRISFKNTQQNDPQYAALLQSEWNFCRANEASIRTKAKQVYKIGCNKNHPLNYTCCDFSFLERYYLNYVP